MTHFSYTQDEVFIFNYVRSILVNHVIEKHDFYSFAAVKSFVLFVVAWQPEASVTNGLWAYYPNLGKKVLFTK